MLTPSQWMRFRFGLLAALLTASTADLVRAQCSCASDLDLGQCVIRVLDSTGPNPLGDPSYPDAFPAAGTIVRREGAPDQLYVADFFSGNTYVWEYDTSVIETIARRDIVIPSPGGSRTTTGLVFLNDLLLWAVDGEIWQTGTLGEAPVRLGTVDLAQLAELVRTDSGDDSIVTGTLGGITVHEGTGNLWAVDIVNDLYFEIGTDGALVLDGDRPNYFFNPMRGASGGAYGNDLAYVADESGEYFDITAGSLADGRPTRVVRVFATANGDFGVGDETGIFYALDDDRESPQFVTGIVYWPDSCSAGNGSEILLDIDLDGGQPRILEVSADSAKAGTVASLACTANDATSVKLAWTKNLDYGTLTVERTALGSDAAETVLTTTFADDTGEVIDTGLAAGSYEYTLTVTNGGATSPLTCRINLGTGSILATAPFAPSGATGRPYAAAISGANLVVADLDSGGVQFYDLNLEPGATLPSPFPSGTITGVSIAPDETQNERLYWLNQNGGLHSLLATTFDGAIQGDPVVIDIPLNHFRSQLGDLSYDEVNGWFWTVDLLNGVIYPFDRTGSIPEAFRDAQLALDDLQATLTGGISVVSASEGSLTVDLPISDARTGVLDVYARVVFDTSTLAQSAEEFRFDLRETLGTSSVGGVASTAQFGFLAGIDSGLVYKLQTAGTDLPFFRRGDVNDDGRINISDPSAIIGNLFGGGADPACEAAADANSSDGIEIADAIYLFNYLFGGGSAPASPFPGCGVDGGTTLSCNNSICF